MVRAENKYEARLLDKENTWGKPTEEQEKIVAMIAEINSLKKARSGTTTTKTMKQKAAKSKTQANKKPQPKKTKEQKKKTSEKWAWKNKPPKDNDGKEGNTFVKTLKARNIIGASTTTMGLECGPCTTPTIVRQTKLR